jgi:hypothetical protein
MQYIKTKCCIYHKYTHFLEFNILFLFCQIILYNINFVKIKIKSPDNKNETDNYMQHNLEGVFFTFML